MYRPGARTARRADAEHNMAKILDAAAACLSRSTTASVGEIAPAGVGRVTVYGHFPSRQALIEAILTRLLEQGEGRLRAALGGGWLGSSIDSSSSDRVNRHATLQSPLCGTPRSQAVRRRRGPGIAG